MTDPFRPVLIVDTREQTPLPIVGAWDRGILTTGDYSYRGGEHLFSVERKSLADLIGSLTTDRDRFTREMERLRGYAFARLLIIGDRRDLEQGAYRSSATPLAMVNSLAAFEARYVPVVWAPTPEAGADLVERWAYWHAREIVRAASLINRDQPSVLVARRKAQATRINSGADRQDGSFGPDREIHIPKWRNGGTLDAPISLHFDGETQNFTQT